MPTPNRGPRLGGSAAHQRLILANLATELFRHERITTTEAKAKRLRPLAEKLVTFAKRGDLHARRQVLTVVRDKSVAHKLFEEIGPRYTARPGGYTRIVKVGSRQGDNASMALIELVEPLTVAQQAVGEAERARRAPAATKTQAPAVTEPVADAEPVGAEPDEDAAEAVEEPTGADADGGTVEAEAEAEAEGGEATASDEERPS